MSSNDCSNEENECAAEDLPAVKPSSENRPEKKHKQTQSSNNHSSTRTISEDKPTSDDSMRRRQLPPIAKNGLYKTKLCRNYIETGKCKYGRVCQFAHGMKELRKYSLCVCWNDSYIASSHAVSYWKHLMREMGNSQLFCSQGWPPSQRMRTYR